MMITPGKVKCHCCKCELNVTITTYKNREKSEFSLKVLYGTYSILILYEGVSKITYYCLDCSKSFPKEHPSVSIDPPPAERAKRSKLKQPPNGKNCAKCALGTSVPTKRNLRLLIFRTIG